MIEQYYIVLGCTLIVLMLAAQQGRKWWTKAQPAPLGRGDLVVVMASGTPTYRIRRDSVFEVLSHPRSGFVAIRQRGQVDGRYYPILVVAPSCLQRVRRAQ